MKIIIFSLLASLGLVHIFPINNDYKSVFTIADSTNSNAVEVNNEDLKTWGQNKINLYKALEVSNPTNTIKIGVLDTGIDSAHESLKLLCDTNLSISYIINSAFSKNEDISDQGHGTHVAGIISCITNYSNIKLVSYTVMDQTGGGNYANKIKAIKQATQDDIDILNICSSGKDDGFSSSVYLAEAIKEFKGLVICSAGNNSLNVDHPSNGYKRYPACIEEDNVISVGASDYNDLKSTYSNYGKTSIDLFAPGDNIYSCLPKKIDKSGYGYKSGTSMATPMVTGVAALLLSNYPSLSTKQLKQAILNSVDKVEDLKDKCVTGGRLNAYNALMYFHKHNYVYQSNENGHTYRCSCGQIKTYSGHNIEIKYDSKTHSYKCDCGYEKSGSHIFTFKYIDSKCHGEVCSCGYYINSSPHIIKQDSIVNKKAICLECNALLDLNYNFGILPFYDITYITNNYSYKLPNGIIVLTTTDYNLYKDGLLSFNYDDLLLS